MKVHTRLFAYLISFILFLPIWAHTGDVSPTAHGKVHGQPFESLQQQIDELKEALKNIQLVPGPEGPQGPAGPPGPSPPMGPKAVAHAWPLRGFIDEPIDFFSRGSFSPIPNVTLSYFWDFADGSVANTNGENVTHSYGDSGYFVVVLAVTDSQGLVDVAHVEVRVVQPLSVRDLSQCAPGPPPNLPFNFNCYLQITGGTPPYSVHWEFGDGVMGEGNPVTHTYDLPGPRTITVTVADSEGYTSTQSLSFELW